jgi:hypothetical protein
MYLDTTGRLTFTSADKLESYCVPNCLTFQILAVISRITRFNIQKFYMVLTLRLSVQYGLFPCTPLTDRFCIPEVESVYCAVRTESLHKADVFVFKRLNQGLVMTET